MYLMCEIVHIYLFVIVSCQQVSGNRAVYSVYLCVSQMEKTLLPIGYVLKLLLHQTNAFIILSMRCLALYFTLTPSQPTFITADVDPRNIVLSPYQGFGSALFPCSYSPFLCVASCSLCHIYQIQDF